MQTTVGMGIVITVVKLCLWLRRFFDAGIEDINRAWHAEVGSMADAGRQVIHSNAEARHNFVALLHARCTYLPV